MSIQKVRLIPPEPTQNGRDTAGTIQSQNEQDRQITPESFAAIMVEKIRDLRKSRPLSQEEEGGAHAV